MEPLLIILATLLIYAVLATLVAGGRHEP